VITPADASELLTLAAAFDRRTIGRADALAWADALHDLDPRDCADAIRTHFRESTEYLMPVHVRTGVKAIRAERLRRYGRNEPEYDGNDVAGGLEAIREHNRRVAAGEITEPPKQLAGGPRTADVARLVTNALRGIPTDPDVRPVVAGSVRAGGDDRG
jgi:hypothetical protein